MKMCYEAGHCWASNTTDVSVSRGLFPSPGQVGPSPRAWQGELQGVRQEARSGCGQSMQSWSSSWGPWRQARPGVPWNMVSSGCNFWKGFLKDTQTLFLLPPAWNGDTIAAETPPILHHEASVRMKATHQRWKRTKSQESWPLDSAQGCCVRVSIRCCHPMTEENNPICLSRCRRVSVTASQMQFLNNPITVWKLLVICFPMDK